MVEKDNKELSDEVIVTDSDLVNALNKNMFGSFLIIEDQDGNEYTIDSVSMDMAGQFHQVISLKKIEDEHQKFYKSLKVQVEEQEDLLKLFKSDDWKEDAIKTCSAEWYEKHIKDEERYLDLLKRRYEKEEVKS